VMHSELEQWVSDRELSSTHTHMKNDQVIHHMSIPIPTRNVLTLLATTKHPHDRLFGSTLRDEETQSASCQAKSE
jgi:hypothetical protein